MNETEKELKKTLSWTKGSRVSRNDSKLTWLLERFAPNIDDYEIHEEPIGKGRHSLIYLARHIPTSVFVAMKRIDLTQIKDTHRIDEIAAQIRNWRLRYHPCLLTNFVTFVHDEYIWSACQLMSAGSCFGMIDAFFKEGLEEALAATILKEILKAIVYLHEHSIIHNHIRAEHILVDADGDIKLCGHTDMTWMISEGVRRTVVYDFKGEPEWMAPEIMAQDTGYDCKADIYSFGMTALELTNGRTPYREWPPLKILLHKLHKKYPPLQTAKKGLSRSFYQMVASCLAKDPAKRPSAAQLLIHPFFKQVKDKSYVASHLVEKVQHLRQEMNRNGTFHMSPSIATFTEEDDPMSPLQSKDHTPNVTWES